MVKFKEYVEKNSTIGDFNPHPEVDVDTVAGNYMKGRVRGMEFEVFVHKIPMGHELNGSRVYKMKVMEPKQITSFATVEEGKPLYNAQVFAEYDRGWILEPVDKDEKAVVNIVKNMFPNISICEDDEKKFKIRKGLFVAFQKNGKKGAGKVIKTGPEITIRTTKGNITKVSYDDIIKPKRSITYEEDLKNEYWKEVLKEK